jgi:hypothetical protein
MGVATRVTMRVVMTPLTVTLSLTSESEPLLLPGTLPGTLIWSGTSVMGLTMLSCGGRDQTTRVIDRMTRPNEILFDVIPFSPPPSYHFKNPFQNN